MEDQRTMPEAQAVAELVKDLHGHQELTLRQDGHPSARVVVAPQGMVLHSIKEFLDEYRLHPEHRVGTAAVGDIDSFIKLTNRFAMPGVSAIFASPDPKKPSLTTVLDYHEGPDGPPHFCQHRVHYAFPVADEWTTWTTRADGGHIAQAPFAAFIEDHLLDVADPATAHKPALEVAKTLGIAFAAPSRLLELSRGLSVRVDSQCAQKVNLQTGETQLLYADAHKNDAGQPLQVPGGFVLAIPVFRGGALYEIPVRLRYRVKEGAVLWGLQMYRHERVFEHAFKEACDKARAETGLPLFVGSPEA